MNYKQNFSQGKYHHHLELEQEIILLKAFENVLVDKVKNLQDFNKQLEEKLSTKSHYAKEVTQKNLFLNEMNEINTNTIKKLKNTKQNLANHRSLP